MIKDTTEFMDGGHRRSYEPDDVLNALSSEIDKSLAQRALVGKKNIRWQFPHKKARKKPSTT